MHLERITRSLALGSVVLLWTLALLGFVDVLLTCNNSVVETIAFGGLLMLAPVVIIVLVQITPSHRSSQR